MSKLTLASRPATSSKLISALSGSTIGRLESPCEAMGTITQPSMLGCIKGPPALRA